MYHHATAENHGCEALLRTVAGISNDALGHTEITATTKYPEQDAQILGESSGIDLILLDNLNKIFNKNRVFIFGAFAQLIRAIPFKRVVFKDLLKSAKEADVCISVGGDNYSYGKSAAITTMDRYVRKKCEKSVLWGCSINPEMLKGKKYKYKVEGLRKFSLITARESLTYNALKELGFDNVKLRPDPAFTLPVEEPSKPMFDNGKDIVGINISPLIQSYETERNITVECYSALVKHILDNTDYNVAFISHVRCSTTDDSEAARAVMANFEGEDRIKLFDEGNCMELKGYISKCRFFVVARTHASIAAYSTFVPTVVVGYSVKARGIAKDLFNTDENYVIPVQTLKERDTLINAFEWLRANESDIKNRLREIMPEYVANARAAGDDVKALLEE